MSDTTTASAQERLRLPDPPPELRKRLAAGHAVIWSEPITMPTYEPEAPSRYPMFLDHRVYQGSSGRVYPLPFVERIASEPVPREWEAVHLENRWVRIVVLPELGGRIHIGYDKTTGYDFLYRNSVIKPALVGLAGPWISGGIEFNWPQHHRPATYLPVRSRLDEGVDGQVTVWCSDHDPFARMSGTHGIRLRDDNAVLEVEVLLHNRTSERQSFLWWANAAVRVHDEYQSFFPQDVRYVADHARRAITAFPSADRPYYGVDYPARAAAHPGADRIDWYRNIPVPTSYMIVDSQESFFGGYDHAAGAGFVHWADRRISPGKKQWTWGDAPFGHAWDRLLTDEDGPYVELMAGVYTDNQPDFSWLLPGETKSFSQHWYPVPGIGVAHQATLDAALHVDAGGALDGTGVTARAAVTRPVAGAVLRLLDADGRALAVRSGDLEPGDVLELVAPEAAGLAAVELRDRDGALLVRWTPPSTAAAPEPWTASEPPAPADVASVEELWLTGVHLAQYRHPTRSPLPYWREALRRDPGDSRVNVALGERALRAGDYAAAIDHLETACRRLTVRNGNPRDTEAFYLLGLALVRAGDRDAARRAFATASWDGRWSVPARTEAARLDAADGRTASALADALALHDDAPGDPRVAALAVVLLRRDGQDERAAAVLAAARATRPLDVTLDHLADGRMPADAAALDLGIDLARAGELDAALAAIDAAAAIPAGPGGGVAPIAHYVAAALLQRRGREAEAAERRAMARAADREWCFPVGLDAHDALAAALAAEPGDAVAAQLLGTLRYDAGRRRDAVALWRRALESGSADPVLLRNAAVAAYNVEHDDERAVALYEQALAADPDDARLLFERDQLAARLGEPSPVRLARLESRPELVAARDDLLVEYAELLIASGRAAEALALLEGRRFQPWEGGEGRVLGAWDRARDALGLGIGEPPQTLGEARPVAVPPVARHDDGRVDYFATSLPELLLFSREDPE